MKTLIGPTESRVKFIPFPKEVEEESVGREKYTRPLFLGLPVSYTYLKVPFRVPPGGIRVHFLNHKEFYFICERKDERLGWVGLLETVRGKDNYTSTPKKEGRQKDPTSCGVSSYPASFRDITFYGQ